MPDIEEPNEGQIAELDAALRTLQAELRQLLAISADGAKPVELETPIGRLSRMDAMQHQQLAKASRDSHQRRLTAVNGALSRIENGEYGSCLKCEEPIGYRRLQARPESRLCLACQSALERH